MSPTIPVKKHNMPDSRWTVKDKIIQCRGLIKLYERDVKIRKADERVARRKQEKELEDLKRTIADQKTIFRDAILGGTQEIRNILSAEKLLQRTYCNHEPTKIIEELEHKNFAKRKLLDRLTYQCDEKDRKIFALNLELANLKADYICGAPNDSNAMTERCSQLISGKLQEAMIKQDAAIHVQHVYDNILDILKKDKLYFDHVIKTLNTDFSNQSKCLYQVSELGQVATEYVDDCRQEFKVLKAVITRDMKSQLAQLKVVQDQADALQDSLRHLIRKERDINLGIVKLSQDQKQVDVEEEVNGLKDMLKIIQEATYATDFQDIFACLESQRIKYGYLSNLVAEKQYDKNVLSERLNHATVKYLEICHSTNRSDYKLTRADLRHAIKSKRNKQERINSILLERADVVAKIATCFSNAQQICATLVVPDSCNQLAAPDDVLEILSDLEMRLQILMNAQDEEFVNLNQEDVHKCYTKFVNQISRTISYDKLEADDALLGNIEMKDWQVPSADTIKQKSTQICERNAKPAWML